MTAGDQKNAMARVTRADGEPAYVGCKPRKRQADYDRKRAYEQAAPSPRVSLFSRLLGGAS